MIQETGQNGGLQISSPVNGHLWFTRSSQKCQQKVTLERLSRQQMFTLYPGALDCGRACYLENFYPHRHPHLLLSRRQNSKPGIRKIWKAESTRIKNNNISSLMIFNNSISHVLQKRKISVPSGENASVLCSLCSVEIIPGAKTSGVIPGGFWPR